MLKELETAQIAKIIHKHYEKNELKIDDLLSKLEEKRKSTKNNSKS